MSKPHKHADVIKAWADGKTIQVASYPEPTHDDPMAQREPNWRDAIASFPAFNTDMLYRIKPEPLEWQAEREAFERGEKIEWRRVGSAEWQPCPNPVWGSSSQAGGGDEYRIAPKRWAKEREAYARGERVQWRSTSPQHGFMEWVDVPLDRYLRGHIELAFNEPTNEFRIPHKWQREMDAQARGEKVQFRPNSDDDWGDGRWSFDAPEGEYRIKPKTKAHRIRAAMIQPSPYSRPYVLSATDEAGAAKLEKAADFVRWLCDWQEVEVEVRKNPKCEPATAPGLADLQRAAADAEARLFRSLTSGPGAAAVKKALEDCAQFGVGAYSVGFDLGKSGDDRSCLFFRRVHINK